MKIILLFLSGFAAFAQETNLSSLTVGHKNYTNCTLRASTPAYAIISHSGGLAKAPLAELSPDLQQFFRYDPTAPEKSERAEKPVRRAVLSPAQPTENPGQRQLRSIKEQKAALSKKYNEAAKKADQAERELVLRINSKQIPPLQGSERHAQIARENQSRSKLHRQQKAALDLKEMEIKRLYKMND